MVESLNQKAFKEKFESILLLPENEKCQREGGLSIKDILKHFSGNKPLILIISVGNNSEKYLVDSIINKDKVV